ncbi:MAG: nickel-binding protein [Mycobacteriales bacterium]
MGRPRVQERQGRADDGISQRRQPAGQLRAVPLPEVEPEHLGEEEFREPLTCPRTTQAKYGVDYQRYWVDEAEGRVFCLIEAPDVEAAQAVHQEAHGLVAEAIHPIVEGA